MEKNRTDYPCGASTGNRHFMPLIARFGSDTKQLKIESHVGPSRKQQHVVAAPVPLRVGILLV
ncbi:hypothetical protein PanWU01x14_366690 [Parasponia andersonii]|uniref:Uncharacterized protein n=1 Tax=Parasponia andersonii TaxID=3476 RepID=A0A2P5A5N9_PARAD|nr:hypothetical protein PanWU01x14_366690 [Parasponia andersonii]